jgi:hypothetical protein
MVDDKQSNIQSLFGNYMSSLSKSKQDDLRETLQRIESNLSNDHIESQVTISSDMNNFDNDSESEMIQNDIYEDLNLSLSSLSSTGSLESLPSISSAHYSRQSKTPSINGNPYFRASKHKTSRKKCNEVLIKLGKALRNVEDHPNFPYDLTFVSQAYFL